MSGKHDRVCTTANAEFLKEDGMKRHVILCLNIFLALALFLGVCSCFYQNKLQQVITQTAVEYAL